MKKEVGINPRTGKMAIVTDGRYISAKKVTPTVKQILKTLKPRGITVMERLIVYAYATKKDIKKISLEQKQDIGNLIKAKFFEPDRKKFARKITITEPEGVFKVLEYPKAFCPVIDSIVNKYFLKQKGWIKRKVVKIS